MTSTIQLKAAGPEPSQRWQLLLREAEAVRIGRATGDGSSIPWDRLISREHADICWREGELHAKCLPTAKHPLVYQGNQTRELSIAPGERFQIGHTTFEVETPDPAEMASVEGQFGVDTAEALAEHANSEQQLKKTAFGNAERQMEILCDLPGLIASSHSDEELGNMLSQLLLSAIPQAEAANQTLMMARRVLVIDRRKPESKEQDNASDDPGSD